jgi:hypothetical protein
LKVAIAIFNEAIAFSLSVLVSRTSWDLEFAVRGPIVSQHGPHAQTLQETAAGDVFGQVLDGHASLMRRTLDWLSTSLSKGISRDGDRVIFRTALVIRSSPRRAPEATLPISLPVNLKPTLLSLSMIVRLPRGDLTAVKSGQLSADDVET